MYGSTIIYWCRRTGLHSLSTEVGAHTWAHTFLCNKSMFMPFCEGNSSLRSNLYTGQPQTGLVFVNSGLSSPNLEANWSMTSSFVPWNGPPGPKVNGHRLGSFSRDIYHFFFNGFHCIIWLGRASSWPCPLPKRRVLGSGPASAPNWK